MTRKRKSLWSLFALAVGFAVQHGGAILSFVEKLVMRVMSYLTLLDDWEEYAKPLWEKWVSPVLDQGASQLVLDVLTWVLILGALASLVWINYFGDKWKYRQ
jgi:hypothetical protein